VVSLAYPFKWTTLLWSFALYLSTHALAVSESDCTMIKQIKFVTVPVRDQKRALDFYTGKLGFTIITDQPFNERQRWIELRIPKAETRVVLFTPEGQEDRIGSFLGISYHCEDIDQTFSELSARGVSFDVPPKKEPWGTFATFKDSEGNSFVLSSSKG
jgi:predicted enzyme related to lactoylglutathione lyase